MKIDYKKRPHIISLNPHGMMFVLDNARHDVVAYLCARRLTPDIPNQAWVLDEFLPLLVDNGIVTATGTTSEAPGEGPATLCNIVHPDFHDGGYTGFGDVARKKLGQQCQYASRYITGRMEGYPKLGEGLRFKNLDNGDYHSIQIHRDDIEEFVRRYKAYEAERLAHFG